MTTLTEDYAPVIVFVVVIVEIASVEDDMAVVGSVTGFVPYIIGSVTWFKSAPCFIVPRNVLLASSSELNPSVEN